MAMTLRTPSIAIAIARIPEPVPTSIARAILCRAIEVIDREQRIASGRMMPGSECLSRQYGDADAAGLGHCVPRRDDQEALADRQRLEALSATSSPTRDRRSIVARRRDPNP